MSFVCEPELLEDLARGRIDGMRVVELEAHVAGCASCKRELQWLVAERELATRRAAAEGASKMPLALWQKVELATLAGAAEGVFSGAQTVARKSIGRFWWRAGAVVGALILGGFIAKAIKGERAEERREHPAEHGFKFHLDSPQPSHGHLISVTTVPGPIALRIGSASAEIRISAGSPSLLRVTADDSDAHGIDVKQSGGNQFEVLFDGRQARSGTIVVEVPPGSSADVTTASGDVTLERLGAGARVHTASGQITVEESDDFDAESASGDVHATGLKCNAHVRTVSGDVHLELVAAAHVDANTTSGDFDLQGVCGADCGIGFHTISGDASLELDPQSSFNLSFHSRSGDFTDELHLTEITQRREGGPSGTLVAGRYGKGEANIDINTLSGDLTLNRK